MDSKTAFKKLTGAININYYIGKAATAAIREACEGEGKKQVPEKKLAKPKATPNKDS